MNMPSNWLKNTLTQLQNLIQTERRIGVEILEILWEIERRKSYSELNYDGMYSFCIRELKFTEAQAYHRLQAMRALKTHTEKIEETLKQKIESGAMSMSTVAQVQVFLRKEQVHGVNRNETEKLQIFNQFENKTSLEVKKEIAELKGTQFKTKLVIELDKETEFLWKEFKAKAAFQTKGDDLLQLKILLQEALKKREPKPIKTSRSVSMSTWANKNLNLDNRDTITNMTTKTLPLRLHHSKNRTGTGASSNSILNVPAPSRHVPAATRRLVFSRDQQKCTQCGSKYALTIEHKIPFANGGTHEPNNLIILCRNCNLHQGIAQFGLETMRRSS